MRQPPVHLCAHALPGCGAVLQRITPLGAGRGLYQPSPQSVQPLGSAASVRSAATASPATRWVFL
jgi:hypothetical protein